MKHNPLNSEGECRCSQIHQWARFTIATDAGKVKLESELFLHLSVEEVSLRSNC